MITNYFISPNQQLKPFINNYILSTSHGEHISYRSQWPATNEIFLIFYLQDAPLHFTNYQDCLLKDKKSYLISLLTHYNGSVDFNGVCHTFVIQFKTLGFSKIFKMPMDVVADRMYCCNDILGNVSDCIHEQLQVAKNLLEMAFIADRFLLSYINKVNPVLSDGLTFVANEINVSSEFLSVGSYASKANMSRRSFERKFSEQIGISPKRYFRLSRFQNAMKQKLLNPLKKWTSIAHEWGYFDQMHMIKDFKHFANVNTGDFFHNNDGKTRSPINLFESDLAIFERLNTNLSNEKFVYVNR